MHPLLTLQNTLGNQAVSRLVVQRAPEPANVVGKGARSYNRRWYTDGQGNKVRLIRMSTGDDHPQGETVSVDYGVRAYSNEQYIAHKKDMSGEVGEYALLSGSGKRFIKIAGLRPQPKGPPDPPKKTAGGFAKRTGEALDIAGTSTDLGQFEKTDKVTKLGNEMKSLTGSAKDAKKNEKTALSDQMTGTDLAVASLSGGTQLISLVGSIQKLVTAKGGWKRAEAGMDVALQTVKMGGSVATIVDKAGKLKYGSSAGFGGQAEGAAAGVEKSTAAAGALGATGEILGGIIAAIKRVKAIVDMVRTKHKVGAKDKADMVMSTLKDATSASPNRAFQRPRASST